MDVLVSSTLTAIFNNPLLLSVHFIEDRFLNLACRDAWRPKVFGGVPSKQTSINHGTYFFHAHEEGLLANDPNIHAGIRTTLSGPSDYGNDGYCGFEIVEAREIDTIGTEGIIKKIRDRVRVTKPVYLSTDIDNFGSCLLVLTLSLLPKDRIADRPIDTNIFKSSRSPNRHS